MKGRWTPLAKFTVFLVFGGVLSNAVGWGLYFWSERPSFRKVQRYDDRPISPKDITE